MKWLHAGCARAVVWERNGRTRQGLRTSTTGEPKSILESIGPPQWSLTATGGHPFAWRTPFLGLYCLCIWLGISERSRSLIVVPTRRSASSFSLYSWEMYMSVNAVKSYKTSMLDVPWGDRYRCCPSRGWIVRQYPQGLTHTNQQRRCFWEECQQL